MYVSPNLLPALSPLPSSMHYTDNRTQSASAKPGFSPSDESKQGEISSKQKGMSNTPTRHSTPIHDNPEKSKKGDGSPETAKAMGTIDPNAPVR
jgi:hypothetical protein